MIADITRLLRFTALCLNTATLKETAGNIVTRAGEYLGVRARACLAAVDGPVVLDSDMKEGETGGDNTALVLKRLRFHARVRRACIGLEGTWLVR